MDYAGGEDGRKARNELGGFLPQPVKISNKPKSRLKMWPASEIPHMAWLISVRDRLRKSTEDEVEEAQSK